MTAGCPILTATLAAAFVSGCAAGPDFVRPSVPAAAGYAPEKLVAETAAADIRGGEAQHLV
jgi:hypothetical protein